MAIFKCKMCGGTLEINKEESVAVCEYCETKQTLPRLDDERRAQMYDRANHFRRNNEFDKAMGIYEQILVEDTTDAEAYWSLVLCRYGIEYVEDPASHRRVPTVNRTQMTSVFADENYKSALQYADIYQKEVYESEAKAIDEIQKGILKISQNEEPFDIFICYKETDNNGRRTQDSVLANDLYHQLTKEGYKVFFSRITLEDKLGTAYEPYIFAALNSAKVMIVLGTKAEYFNSVWVKNEWKRYLALIKEGSDKILIPAYKDMDPYDLPEEFSHLQAQDMSKLGFVQDLIRGIGKIVENDKIKGVVLEKNESVGINLSALLKRAYFCIEDEEWEKADALFEQVLNHNPESAEAYVGKILVKEQIKSVETLKEIDENWEYGSYFKRAMKFSQGELKQQLENAYYQKEARRQREEEKRRQKEKQREEKRRREEEKRRQEEERQKKLKNIKEILFLRDKDIVEKRFNQVLQMDEYYTVLQKDEYYTVLQKYEKNRMVDRIVCRLNARKKVEIEYLSSNYSIIMEEDEFFEISKMFTRISNEVYQIKEEDYVNNQVHYINTERMIDKILFQDEEYQSIVRRYHYSFFPQQIKDAAKEMKAYRAKEEVQAEIRNRIVNKFKEQYQKDDKEIQQYLEEISKKEYQFGNLENYEENIKKSTMRHVLEPID